MSYCSNHSATVFSQTARPDIWVILATIIEQKRDQTADMLEVGSIDNLARLAFGGNDPRIL